MKDNPLPLDSTANDEHPAPETLLAYREDKLQPNEDELVREHLADCADCAALMLELTAEDNIDDFDGELSEIDLQRVWRQAQSRRVRQSSTRAAQSRSALLPLLAAGLLVVLAPLLFLRNTGGRDPVNAVRLSPLDGTRSPQGLERCTTLTDGDAWQLSLQRRDDPGGARVLMEARLEIWTDTRQLVATREVTSSPPGAFIIKLRRADLGTGRYRLHLVDRRPSEPRLIERYCIEILDG